MYLHFSKMSNIEHRPVIKFFTRIRFNAFEITKDLNNVYKDSAPLSPSGWLNSMIQNTFEDASRVGRRPSTITADENTEAVQRIVMRDRQISIRRLAEELAPFQNEMMNNQMDMKKVCTRCRQKFLTPIQRALWSPFSYQELLHQSEANLDNGFSLHRNRRWVLDSPVRSSETVGREDLQEAKWTKTNSIAPRKISWKDDDDHFLE